MTPPVIAHAWDPFHGDPNNRHPRLGAPQQRIVPREQWTDFRHTHPALPVQYGASPLPGYDNLGWTTYDDRQETS